MITKRGDYLERATNFDAAESGFLICDAVQSPLSLHIPGGV
jgi:hypothetical protein